MRGCEFFRAAQDEAEAKTESRSKALLATAARLCQSTPSPDSGSEGRRRDARSVSRSASHVYQQARLVVGGIAAIRASITHARARARARARAIADTIAHALARSSPGWAAGVGAGAAQEVAVRSEGPGRVQELGRAQAVGRRPWHRA